MDSNEDIFNSSNRERNIVRASMLGTGSQIVRILISFAVRTVFLAVLSEDYLGITGLFTNVLQVLNLAELGITTAIAFRFYAPVNDRDIRQVGRLVNFYKRIYRLIALFILTAGLAICPFVKWMIKDGSEIPADVNLYVVYLLFLAETLSSYIFVYKQTLLSADQRNDLVALCQTGAQALTAVVQIVLLLTLHNYTLYLGLGIFTTIGVNFLVSLWITRKYRPVFEVAEQLSREEQHQIYSDTAACMLHKVGATVLTSTDNIVLTKMISLAATGLYSNYAMICTNLQVVSSQLLGNFVSSIGNAKLNLSTEEHYRMYRKMLFLNRCYTCLTTVCLYTLVDDFIVLWLGEHFRLDPFTVVCLAAQYYLHVNRITNGSYINAGGWFVKDKIRPIIEAVLNLGISIWLAAKIGIAGVFLGTILSNLATVAWREPRILFRLEFKKSQLPYWLEAAAFAALTLFLCAGIRFLKIASGIVIGSFLLWILEAVLTAAACCILLTLAFGRTESFCFMTDKLRGLLFRT